MFKGKDTPHAKGYDKKRSNINDKRIDGNGQRIRFSSKILPPYLRRTKSIDELIPWLYLKGISTGDFTEALREIYPATQEQLTSDNYSYRSTTIRITGSI